MIPGKHPARRLPRLGLITALALVVSMSLSAFYTTRLNPEMRHFVGTHRIKQAWAEKMTREHGSKVVVYGGSSCEFSIDGERLLQRHHLPCANLGRGAGMGAVVLTMAALDEVKEGDTLVIALEPALLTEPLDFPNQGIQFSVASGNPHWIRQPLPTVNPVSRVGILAALRPGALHAFTLLAKVLRGQPLYRYRLENMRPSGFNVTPLRLDIQGPPGHGVQVSESARRFLLALRDWCGQHKVRLAYSIPWGYTPSDGLEFTRRINAEFLLQIAQIIPVLKDPALGGHEIREDFSDTAWHLTPEAAARRTDQFASQLKEWRIWTVEQLRDLAAVNRVPP